MRREIHGLVMDVMPWYPFIKSVVGIAAVGRMGFERREKVGCVLAEMR